MPTLALLALLSCTSSPPEPVPEPEPPPPPDPDAWILEGAAAWTTSTQDGTLVLADAAGPQLTLDSVTVTLGKKTTTEPLSWADGTGTATTGPVTWTVTLAQPEPGNPALALAVGAELTEEATPMHLALAGTLPTGDVHILGRDHRIGPLAAETVIDEWTPQHLHTDALSIDARSLAMAATPGDARTSFELVLDDHRLHPFKPLKTCADTMDDDDPKELDRSAVTRPAGTSWSAAATVVLGPSPAVQWLRYPRGYRSALVFTDHADQSNVGKLGALLWGTGSLKDQEGITTGDKGLLGHGLTLTKSVFVKRKSYYARQLDNPEYVELLEAAREAGVEVGSHSVTGLRDEPATVAELLAQQAEAVGPVRTWIDHQPKTNCEALTNSGWNPKSDWYLVPTLQQAGVDFAWAGFDVAPEDGVNLFDPAQPDAWTPVLFSHPDLGDLQVFMSLWRAKDRADLLADYDAEHLDALARDRGLHIAHTYLDTHRAGSFVEGWTLLDAVKGGFAIRTDADALFADLEARQADRRTLVATMADVGDHLHATRDVTWTWTPSRIRLQPKAGAVPGLTLLAPKDLGAPQIDGQPLGDDAVWSDDGGTAFTFDLPAEGAWLSFEQQELRSAAVVD